MKLFVCWEITNRQAASFSEPSTSRTSTEHNHCFRTFLTETTQQIPSTQWPIRAQDLHEAGGSLCSDWTDSSSVCAYQRTWWGRTGWHHKMLTRQWMNTWDRCETGVKNVVKTGVKTGVRQVWRMLWRQVWDRCEERCEDRCEDRCEECCEDRCETGVRQVWDRCVYLWTVGRESSIRHLREVRHVSPVTESKRLKHIEEET